MPEQVLSVKDVDDAPFQHREWVFERVGWVVMGVLLLLAVLGVFGHGTLSTTTAEADDGSVSVEYDRFIRNIGNTTMTVSLGPESVDGKTATLRISRDLAETWLIQNITPTPSTESSDADWVIYEWDVLGSAPPRVKFLYRGDGWGTTHGAMRAGNGRPVAVTQWIYP